MGNDLCSWCKFGNGKGAVTTEFYIYIMRPTCPAGFQCDDIQRKCIARKTGVEEVADITQARSQIEGLRIEAMIGNKECDAE